jgi:hypothetical protein
MYLAGKQREYDLACAARLLKPLAEAGDGGAGGPEADAAVAAADSTPREVWAVLYDWLEEVESDAAALKEKLLGFLACPKRYALVAAIAFAFKDVPQLYALMQGSAARDCGAAIIEQLAGLLAFISEISEDPAALVDHAMQCLSQRLDNSVATLKGQRKPKDAAAVKRSKQQLMADAKQFLPPVIKGAAAAFLTKRDRIDPFLRRMRTRELFNAGLPPVPVPVGKPTWQFLGMTESDDAGRRAGIAMDYGKYCSMWPTEHPASDVAEDGKVTLPSRRTVYLWWKQRASRWPVLVDHALRMCAMPVGNARLEGVFSAVTDMEDVTRLMLGEQAFLNELFLRANRPFVGAVMTLAESYIPVIAFKRVGHKRADNDGASSAAGSAAAPAKRLRPDGSNGGAGAAAGDDDVDMSGP